MLRNPPWSKMEMLLLCEVAAKFSLCPVLTRTAQMFCSIQWSRSAMEQLVFLLALLGATQGFYLPGVAPQDYAKVRVWYLSTPGPSHHGFCQLAWVCVHLICTACTAEAIDEPSKQLNGHKDLPCSQFNRPPSPCRVTL